MNSITYFNRHESMNSETRSMILDTIRELRYVTYESNGEQKFFFSLENYLYGTFDGYDYSHYIFKSDEFKKLKFVNIDLAYKVTYIFETISKYPRTVDPNNNQF